MFFFSIYEKKKEMLYIIIGILCGPILFTLMKVISHTVFNILVTIKKDKVYKIDQILKRVDAVGPRKPNNTIAQGWHRAWYNGGWLVANRECAYSDHGHERITYTVYFIGSSAYQILCNELTSDDNKVVTMYEESLSPWITNCYDYNDRRELISYPRQSEIIDDIVTDYVKSRNSMWLIKGPPGVGKTTIAELVGRCLQKETGMAVFKTAVDLTSPGKGVVEYLQRRDQYSILIFEFNEYDTSIRTASGELACETKDVSCYASTKTSLNNLIDFLKQQDRLVIIASTNALDIDTTLEYESYIRRFDKVVTF